jgi:hypothetical protein
VGPDLAPDAAAAARLRGLRPGALLGAARALPAARRRGQHPRRQLHHAGPVLPSAAPPGADRQAAAAGDDDAEEPAAPAGRSLASRRPDRGPLPARCSPSPASTRAGHAAAAVQRQDLLRHRLHAARQGANPGVAVGRVELLYPFPQAEILKLMRATRTLRRSSGSRRSRATWALARTCRRACCRSCPRASGSETCASATSAVPERAASGEGYPVAHAREQDPPDRHRPRSRYDNFLGMLGRGPFQLPRGDGFTIAADGYPADSNPTPSGATQRAFRMPTTCQFSGADAGVGAVPHPVRERHQPGLRDLRKRRRGDGLLGAGGPAVHLRPGATCSRSATAGSAACSVRPTRTGAT